MKDAIIYNVLVFPKGDGWNTVCSLTLSDEVFDITDVRKIIDMCVGATNKHGFDLSVTNSHKQVYESSEEREAENLKQKIAREEQAEEAHARDLATIERVIVRATDAYEADEAIGQVACLELALDAVVESSWTRDSIRKLMKAEGLYKLDV